MKTEVRIQGAYDRPVMVDFTWLPSERKQPLVLFLHGFKGFKDWGPFNLVADQFAKQGFVFAKMNFSFNGVTPAQPTDFADLEAFGQNNFTKELSDVKTVLDHAEEHRDTGDIPDFDPEQIYLMAHSKGGATSIIYASEDPRIKKLVTLASITDIERYANPTTLQDWKKKGVMYIYNGRTGQNMPLYYQLVEDILGNPERFAVLAKYSQLTIPTLIIHGTADAAVAVEEAERLAKAKPTAQKLIIPQGDHTFGGSHPYKGATLPTDLNTVIQTVVDFLQN